MSEGKEEVPGRFLALRVDEERVTCKCKRPASGKAAPSRGNRGRAGEMLLPGPAANACVVLEGNRRRGDAPRGKGERLHTAPPHYACREEVDVCSWLQPGL